MVCKSLLPFIIGADITKDDGVYSRFFKDFKANGRYSVSVQVDNAYGTGAVQDSIVEKAAFLIDPDDPDSGKSHTACHKN